MRTFILNNKESKTLLSMADNCIDRGMVGEDYEINKINDIIDYNYRLYGESKKELQVEIIVKVRGSYDNNKNHNNKTQ